MDYGQNALVIRHGSWTNFIADPARAQGRLVLFTTAGAQNFTAFRFEPGDTLLFGQESAGAPDFVHSAAQARLVIPTRPPARSLNIVTTAAMALGEALRQTDGFPSGAALG